MNSVAIIGGGLAGLTTAHRLAQRARESNKLINITLCEAAPRWGGAIRTTKRENWLIESGADSFITNRPGGIELCRELGLESQLIPTDPKFRRSLICHRGRPVPTPVGFELMAPRRIGPLLRSPLLTWKGKLRVLAEYFQSGAAPADESVASFARRRFGREAFENIIQPMIGGIYASDPEKLSLAATLPRFLEMERSAGSVQRAFRRESKGKDKASAEASGARYGLFASLRDGMQTLIDALVESLSAPQSAVSLRLATPITVVTRTETGWMVRGPQGADACFDAVVLTCPTYHVATMLSADSAPSADLASLIKELKAIEYSSTTIVVTGHELKDVADPLDAFGLIVPANEHRRIMAVSFPSRKFPGRAPEGCVQLRTFVGGALQPELMALDDAQLTALVQDELKALLGVAGPPQFVQITRYQRAMPQYHLGHLARVDRIEQQLSNLPGLFLTGIAYRGVGIPDVIQQARATADQIVAVA